MATSTLTRRDVLRASLALGAATAAAASFPAAARGQEPLPLGKVVYDVRFPASRLFGDECRRHGATVQGVGESVHALWHDDLRVQWEESSAAVAGMTTPDALFLIALMARDARRDVIYRAHHVPGMATHATFGPRSALRMHPPLAGSDPHWPLTAARIVTAWPAHALERSPGRSSLMAAHSLDLPRDALVTWIIAARA